MATKLFSTKDRAASHKRLEEILKAGQHPKAECRESGDEYSVWDGPEERTPEAPAPDMVFTPEFADVVAEKLAKLLKG